MSNQNFPDISVGDFAMDILKNMAKDPTKALKPALKESTIQSANAPDVSQIEVSQDFVSLITEGKKPVKATNKLVEAESTEDKLESLVSRLSSLLTEARQLIENISPGCTMVGNIGVNMAGPSKSSKKNKKGKGLLTYKVANKVSESEESDKNNPWAICHSSVGKKKTDKFERCVQKIKKKYGIS